MSGLTWHQQYEHNFVPINDPLMLNPLEFDRYFHRVWTSFILNHELTQIINNARKILLNKKDSPHHF